MKINGIICEYKIDKVNIIDKIKLIIQYGYIYSLIFRNIKFVFL